MRRGLLSCPENTRRAARVINVPPPYKVLNFRSVRKRNISRNTGTAATETLQYIRPGEGGRGENYSADEDVNIGELYRSWARAQGGHAGHAEAHIVLTKGRIQVYRGFCKSDLFFEKVKFPR